MRCVAGQARAVSARRSRFVALPVWEEGCSGTAREKRKCRPAARTPCGKVRAPAITTGMVVNIHPSVTRKGGMVGSGEEGEAISELKAPNLPFPPF